MAEVPGPDLPLTGIERRVLALLAEGHTPKTAAVELGLTENAVNERLREARRKTGVGSSRELARKLAAANASQENRDEEIGMAAAPLAGQHVATDPPHRATGRWPKVLIAMSIITAAGLFAVLHIVGVADVVARKDPLLAAIIAPDDGEARVLHARLRSEDRDGDWAAAKEALLLNEFRRIPGLAALRMTCGRTICEAAGLLLPGRDLSRAMGALPTLTIGGLAGVGLQGASVSVGSRDEPVSQPVRPGGAGVSGTPFAAYFRRAAGTGPVVTGSTPDNEGVAPAGALALSVTFDRPMRRDSYSFTTSDVGPFPDCDPEPQVSDHARTFTLRCTVAAGKVYAVGVNQGQFRNFVGIDGTPALPKVIRFAAR